MALTAAVIAVVATLAPAAAAELCFDVTGRARFRALALTDFPLDDEGFRHGQRTWGTMLLRLSPELRLSGEVLARVQVQVLDGQTFGDDSAVGGDAVLRPWRETAVLDQLALREAYVQIPVHIGALRIGRMASNWGLGMLANGGDAEDFLFADVSHGDIVNRAMFITRPLGLFDLGVASEALHLVLAADLVEQDELTDRLSGDLAWQAVGAVLWRQPELEGGLYVAHRSLEREGGAELRATAVDLYGRWSTSFADRWGLEIGFEGALITGETNELEFENTPELLEVLQMGFVARAALDDEARLLSYGLELGFASGDHDTQDGMLRAFRFDPGYKAGMILFEEVLGRVTARGADRASDPALSATPPKGIGRAPSNGSITNAAYVYPTVRWSPLDELFQARVGLLLAFSAGDVVDPRASADLGGYNANSYGKANAHGLLGVELNAGLDVRVGDDDALVEFRVGAEYGLFAPGPALEGAGGGPGPGTIHKARFLSDVRW